MKLNEQIDRVELLIEAISPFAGGIKTATRPTVFPLKGIGQKTQVTTNVPAMQGQTETRERKNTQRERVLTLFKKYSLRLRQYINGIEEDIQNNNDDFIKHIKNHVNILNSFYYIYLGMAEIAPEVGPFKSRFLSASQSMQNSIKILMDIIESTKN